MEPLLLPNVTRGLWTLEIRVLSREETRLRLPAIHENPATAIQRTFEAKAAAERTAARVPRKFLWRDPTS